jgi:hypothetical protein
MRPSNIPKRYWWVAAGAAFTFGAMYLRNKLGNADADRGSDAGAAPSPPAQEPSADDPPAGEHSEPLPGGVKELSDFLAGESWFDEAGWKGLWEREGIDDPAAWVKSTGLDTLKAERAKLTEHPALLAGCRRRWLVVARYAGIDVSDAAELWHQTDG